MSEDHTNLIFQKQANIGTFFWATVSNPLHLCWSPIVPLGLFDGRVAAVIEGFVCTTLNQSHIPLPSLHKMEVQLCADVCYGPDDPMLWPQPWVKTFCHLGAIPRKPNDANNPLSIMWWNPTHDDFKSFGGSLVDGLGQLSGSRLFLLQTIMSNMEDRIKQHKQWWRGPASIPRKPILFHF